jgi:succinyl-CoA synthetase beta subunit
MSKCGVKVPKDIVVSSVAEVKQAIRDVFPGEKEVVVKS